MKTSHQTFSVSYQIFFKSYFDNYSPRSNALALLLQFFLFERHSFVGSAMIVKLPAPVAKGTEITIKIVYSTTQKCSAVQWLEPSQTAGKVHPYLFSQCQAIHARSLLPVQVNHHDVCSILTSVYS